jgi:hypothetical protein
MPKYRVKEGHTFVSASGVQHTGGDIVQIDEPSVNASHHENGTPYGHPQHAHNPHPNLEPVADDARVTTAQEAYRKVRGV